MWAEYKLKWAVALLAAFRNRYLQLGNILQFGSSMQKRNNTFSVYFSGVRSSKSDIWKTSVWMISKCFKYVVFVYELQWSWADNVVFANAEVWRNACCTAFVFKICNKMQSCTHIEENLLDSAVVETLLCVPYKLNKLPINQYDFNACFRDCGSSTVATELWH